MKISVANRSHDNGTDCQLRGMCLRSMQLVSIASFRDAPVATAIAGVALLEHGAIIDRQGFGGRPSSIYAAIESRFGSLLAPGLPYASLKSR
jgi:hypothetical protein